MDKMFVTIPTIVLDWEYGDFKVTIGWLFWAYDFEFNKQLKGKSK